MNKKYIYLLAAISLSLNSSVALRAEVIDENNQVTEQVITQEVEDAVSEEEEMTQEEEVIQEEEILEPSPLPEEEEHITDGKVILTLDSKVALVDGEEHLLTQPPMLINGSTYLPLRFIADYVLQADIKWNGETQTVTVTKDDIQVVVTVEEKMAYMNGTPIELETVPVMTEGVTYLPLRFMSEQFNMDIQYDQVSRTVTLMKKDRPINNKPIASFKFSQDSYVAGQSVSAISTSFDPDHDKLKDKLWSVAGDKTVTNKELSNIFKTPRAGVYTIGLKVQDEYGLWSDWAYQEITVLPNEAPRITHLKTNKESYAQGEDIKFEFLYENEGWESIVNEKWTYRKVGEDVKKAILGKPDTFFAEGDYIVTLQIDDSYGNRSEVAEVIVHITDEIIKKELEFRFTEGHIGDIIDNYQGFNYREYIDVANIQKSTISGTMLMSDSPENVSREGILYRDAILGEGRILLHHINSFSETSVLTGNKRLVLVAENTSNQPVTLTLGNKTIRGPVSDVLLVGQRMLSEYLQGKPDEVIILQPGERRYIYDSGTKWGIGTCISGLMDVHTTGEVTFTVAAVSPGNTINNMNDMELFLQAVHPRGTFDTVAIEYNVELDGSVPEKLLIGTGEEEWVKGYDALTHAPAQNKGNFGISYYITITAKEDTGVILNPRATTFKGAIEWEGMGVYNIPMQGAIYSNTAKAVSLGVIKAGETVTLEYMLPNGSAAPVLLGFIPKSYWGA